MSYITDAQQWEAQHQCPGSHVHKRGMCDECGVCRRCPPPPSCGGAQHVGSGERRSSASSAERRPLRTRQAKTNAKRRVTQCVTERTPEIAAVDQDARDQDLEATATVQAVLKALRVRSDKRRPMKSSAFEEPRRTAHEWNNLLHTCLRKLLAIFVDGDVTVVRKFFVRSENSCRSRI